MGFRTLVLAAVILAGCGSLDHRTVPESLAGKAEIPGLPGIRYWGDEQPPDMERRIAEIEAKARERYSAASKAGGAIAFDHLAISGGGEYGAFAAGLLAGWTDKGGRPEFVTVTGVSVGAIVAPFAFLGPRYDARLYELIRSFGDVPDQEPELLAAIFGMSLLDNRPLQRIIERFITADMLAVIAAEHRRGRRLLIATTNLHAARPVIWDIGKLAASGHANALPLLHKIIAASTAVPGAFAPVIFSVEAEGQRYEELHVDGAVTTVVFFYPPQIKAAELFARLPFRQRLYIIRNRKLVPDYEETLTDLLAVSERAIDAIVRSQGNGDLYQIFMICKRDGIDYNLAYIPSSFDTKSNGLFDHEYMQALYSAAYALGVDGYRWAKGPPGME